MALFKVQGFKREDGKPERVPMWPQLVNAESNDAARAAYAFAFAIRWAEMAGPDPKIVVRADGVR